VNIRFIVQSLLMRIRIRLFKKVVFDDDYGMKYYLWENTRPIGTLQQGVRTDDTTMLVLIDAIINQLKKRKKNTLTCFDVGGFIGVISLAMLKALEGKGIVHIFEPVRTNFFRVSENIKMNGCSNVVINNFAISNKRGIGLQNITTDAGSEFLQMLCDQSGTTEGEDLAARTKSLNVASKQLTIVSTLDDYMTQCSIDYLDILKIDAEWVDHLVVRGLGERLKEQSVGAIFVEYNHGSEASEDLLRIFNEYDYTMYFMVRNEGKVVSNLEYYPENAKECLNMLALSKELDVDTVNTVTQYYLIK
jgi:FkbM family methyltransferase